MRKKREINCQSVGKFMTRIMLVTKYMVRQKYLEYLKLLPVWCKLTEVSDNSNSFYLMSCLF